MEKGTDREGPEGDPSKARGPKPYLPGAKNYTVQMDTIYIKDKTYKTIYCVLIDMEVIEDFLKMRGNKNMHV